MNEQNLAARIGMRAALQLRKTLSIPREVPVNVYEVASQVGVDVRFMDNPSLEGMFCREPGPLILLPSLKHRPAARIAFSCGHELGHQQLNHGTHVDEYIEDVGSHEKPSEEVTADVFAAQLLMPRPAVAFAFERRLIEPRSANAVQLFTIARELGVGYQTVLRNLRSQAMVSSEFVDELRRTTPKKIRIEILGEDTGSELTVIDENWFDVPIDLQVGDVLALPLESDQFPQCICKVKETTAYRIFAAKSPGIGEFLLKGQKRKIRVSRLDYVGPFKRKFLEDPESE